MVSYLNGPPLLAAGGISSGSQIASLLTLGASGVVLGTLFLLSPESLYSNAQRQALLDAESSQSVRTMAFDHARNTLGWPEGIDGRGLRNGNSDFQYFCYIRTDPVIEQTRSTTTNEGKKFPLYRKNMQMRSRQTTTTGLWFGRALALVR